MRRAARKDDNKDAIVSALRSAGCYVYDLKQPVDLLVGARGQTLLMEIKDGAKSPSRQRHTPAQEKFLAEWSGGHVVTVTSVDEALSAVCDFYLTVDKCS